MSEYLEHSVDDGLIKLRVTCCRGLHTFPLTLRCRYKSRRIANFRPSHGFHLIRGSCYFKHGILCSQRNHGNRPALQTNASAYGKQAQRSAYLRMQPATRTLSFLAFPLI